MHTISRTIDPTSAIEIRQAQFDALEADGAGTFSITVEGVTLPQLIGLLELAGVLGVKTEVSAEAGR